MFSMIGRDTLKKVKEVADPLFSEEIEFCSLHYLDYAQSTEGSIRPGKEVTLTEDGRLLGFVPWFAKQLSTYIGRLKGQ